MSIRKPLSRPLSRRAFLATLAGASGAALLGACQGLSGTAGEAPRPATTTQPVEPTAVPSQAYSAPGSSGAYSGKTVAIQVWGGGFAQVIRDLVQPAFERDNDVLLTVAEASSVLAGVGLRVGSVTTTEAQAMLGGVIAVAHAQENMIVVDQNPRAGALVSLNDPPAVDLEVQAPPEAIPEPASVLLFATGLALILILVMRRRAG